MTKPNYQCMCITLPYDNILFTIYGKCWQHIYRVAIFATEAYDLKFILFKKLDSVCCKVGH